MIMNKILKTLIAGTLALAVSGIVLTAACVPGSPIASKNCACNPPETDHGCALCVDNYNCSIQVVCLTAGSVTACDAQAEAIQVVCLAQCIL